MNGLKLRVGLGFGMGVLAAGCASEPSGLSDGEAEALGQVQSAATISQVYTDGSGKLRMTIKTCDWVGTTSGANPTKQNQATCPADAGWRMAGGGAEIENQPVNGAYLLASAPDAGGGRLETMWAARSKGPAAHRLRAYVIQLQADGVDPYDSDFVSQADNATSVDSNTPSFDFDFDHPDSVFLGGGASLLPPDLTHNGALTDIVPYRLGDEDRIFVRGSMFNGTTAGIKAYAFSIKRCPSYLNGGCIMSEARAGNGGTNSGYSSATSAVGWPGVMVGIGGVAVPNGGGKYLADLIPFSGSSPGVTVRSYTNGGVADNGPSRYHAIKIWVDGQPQSFNVINFAGSGAFYRSGSTLQQLGFANTAQHKWHLESVPGTGVYLIRTGNPGYGGSCAYRNGTNVSVGSTCSGAAYQWQAHRNSVTSGNFSLKNVESGTCLDSNLNTLNTSVAKNVVLKTCTTSGAWQNLFLSQYDNWPPPQ